MVAVNEPRGCVANRQLFTPLEFGILTKGLTTALLTFVAGITDNKLQLTTESVALIAFSYFHGTATIVNELNEASPDSDIPHSVRTFIRYCPPSQCFLLTAGNMVSILGCIVFTANCKFANFYLLTIKMQ